MIDAAEVVGKSALDQTTGQTALAYRGAVPWHGLGSAIDPTDDIDTITRKAGLAFTVERSQVEFKTQGADGAVVYKPHAGRDVLYRSDTLAPLGIMSKGYKIVQPSDIMGFFKELADAGGFEIETAGALRGGAKIWALAKVAEAAEIVSQDWVEPYLLLATSFDGSLSTIGTPTAIRVVCKNTMNSAIADAKGVRIPHHATFDPANVREQLGIALTGWEQWLQGTRKMAAKKLMGSTADDFLVELLGRPKVEPDAIRESNNYRTIMAMFEGKATGSELTGGRTAWQMLNSVTEFVDHVRGNSADARLNAAWFGAGDTMKSKAFELLASAAD